MIDAAGNWLAIEASTSPPMYPVAPVLHMGVSNSAHLQARGVMVATYRKTFIMGCLSYGLDKDR